MKKYFLSFMLFLFAFSLGIVFAEESLIAQSTAVKVDNLTFQIPAGFVKDPSLGYKRQSSEFYKIEYINIQAFPKQQPNWSDEQVLEHFKKLASNSDDQVEEVNVNGKRIVLVKKNFAALNAYFCENGMLYLIVYNNMDREKDYNTAKSFVMNIIRTAK